MEAGSLLVVAGVLLGVFSQDSFALTPFLRTEKDTSPRANPCDSGCFTSNFSDSKAINFVCGSDGFTYLNFGELDCVRKNCKRDIRLKQYGRCPRIEDEPILGQTDIRMPPLPPAGRDNSLLRFLSQIPDNDVLQTTTPKQRLIFPVPYSLGRVKNDDVPLKHLQQNENPWIFNANGNSRKSKKICIPDECDCSGEELRPICGSDSVSYGNQCLMECNKECHPDVVKYHDGHCGKLFLKGSCVPNECGCPEELLPVCGSDSVTYGNRCLLECSKNCDSNVKYVYEGYCGHLFFPKSSIGAT